MGDFGSSEFTPPSGKQRNTGLPSGDIRDKPITDTGNGFEINRALQRVVQPPAKLCNQCVHIRFPIGLRISRPEQSLQFLPRDDFASPLHQELEKLNRFAMEAQIPAFLGEDLQVEIELKVAKGDKSRRRGR